MAMVHEYPCMYAMCVCVHLCVGKITGIKCTRILKYHYTYIGYFIFFIQTYIYSVCMCIYMYNSLCIFSKSYSEHESPL